MAAATRLSRRTLLKYGAFGVMAATGSALPAFGAPLSGCLRGVSTNLSATMVTSHVVTLDIATGQIEYTPLPGQRAGHSLIPLPSGGYYAVSYGDHEAPCLFLDRDMTLVGELRADNGYGFGGHAVVLPDNRHVLGHFNRNQLEAGAGTENFGDLFVVDIATRKVIHRQKNDVIHAHDIIVSRDRKTAIVSDDGTLDGLDLQVVLASDDPFQLPVISPSLKIYDVASFALVKTIPLPINGSVVHIEQGFDGAVFGGVEQFVATNPTGLAALRAVLGDDAGRYIKQLGGDTGDKVIPFPGPVVRVDLATSNVEQDINALNQDPFDMKYNPHTGYMLSIFTTSDRLARFNSRNAKWDYFDTLQYGIKEPFGMVDLTGTPLVAINGFDKGIAIIDVTTMTLVKHFDTQNLGTKHLLYEA